MNPTSKEIIQKQLEIIPAGVREAITKVAASNYVQKLAERHRLRVDQAGVLEDELMIVLLGLESPFTFVNNLVREGKIPADVASNIVRDINEDVFNRIRHELAEFYRNTQKKYEAGDTSEEKESVPPAASVIYPQKPVTPAASPQNPPAQSTPAVPSAPTPVTQGVQGNTVRTLENDFAKEKMEGAFRMPPEKTQTDAKPAYNGADPYREPTK